MTQDNTEAGTEVTGPQLRAMHHLIDRGPDDLEIFKPETKALLLDAGRAVYDPDSGRLMITDRGRLEADRPDTIPAGVVTAVCDPSTRSITVSASELDLFVIGLPPASTLWQHWRELAYGALRSVAWAVAGEWKPADNDDPHQARTWRAPLLYLDPAAEPVRN